jgi:hypothetical protein
MNLHVGSRREGGMSSFRKSLPALIGLLVVGVAVVGSAAPALAAPPYPNGAQATALVSGTPLVQATCTTAPTRTGGNSTLGPVSVGYPAGARCDVTSAAADGLYAIAGATPPLPNTLRFSADCVNSTGVTGGGVDVPAGTRINGGAPVTAQTTITTLNTPVVYPNGTTAIVNEVTTTPTSVTRIAVHITGGVGAGTSIGRVICGQPFPYPLAVDSPGASAATPSLATHSSSASSHSSLLLVAGGVLLLLVGAQVVLGRNMLRRRRSLGTD